MCGFAGFYYSGSKKSNIQLDIDALARMGEALIHRGPNSGGVEILADGRVGFAHRRLSILDLTSAGAQPMRSASGNAVMVFNGEIYNHLDIRDQINIENPNKKWRGESDTETMLEAIEIWGIDTAIRRFQGMFSFAYLAIHEGLLILGRDRLGEKPLYFGWQGSTECQTLLFGSQLKALKKHPSFQNKISKNALSLYMRYGYVPAPYSIYEGINKLEPGNFIKINIFNGAIEGIAYWSAINSAVIGQEVSKVISHEGDVDKLDELLSEVVKGQMQADVPVGVFLSGGIDSSLIAAIMQKNSLKRIQSFTIQFENKSFDESSFARDISNSIGTEHHEICITASDALDLVPELPNIYDEPFADSSQIPTYLISKYAKGYVSAVLSGDGGDEVFGGYNRYIFLKNYQKVLQPLPQYIKNSLNKAIDYFPLSAVSYGFNFFGMGNYQLDRKIAKVKKIISANSVEEYYSMLVESSGAFNTESKSYGASSNQFINKYFSQLSEVDPVVQMMAVDMKTYLADDILVKVDRATMANSLESRAPFLDHRVVEFGLRLPLDKKIKNGKGKVILRELLGKYVPKKLFERGKMGFSLPLGEWLRGPLREWADLQIKLCLEGDEECIDREWINNIWKEHLSCTRNWERELWNIIMYQSWLSSNSD